MWTFAWSPSVDIIVELVSPPDFVPELSGWRDRSPFVMSAGHVTVRHFDPYSQALAKSGGSSRMQRKITDALGG